MNKAFHRLFVGALIAAQLVVLLGLSARFEDRHAMTDGHYHIYKGIDEDGVAHFHLAFDLKDSLVYIYEEAFGSNGYVDSLSIADGGMVDRASFILNRTDGKVNHYFQYADTFWTSWPPRDRSMSFVVKEDDCHRMDDGSVPRRSEPELQEP